MRSLFACFVLLTTVPPAVAQKLKLSGSASGEFRLFYFDPLAPEQLEHFQPSFILEPELQFRTKRHQFKITPFYRLDAEDSERTHFDLREAFWRGIFGDWEVLAGVNKVFWGVTESLHLVDIINQTDFLEDIDGEDKLGQPMVSAEWQSPWGRVSSYALLGFRTRPFPGPNGRLRLPLPVDNDRAVFPDGKRNVDFAFRYSHFIGDFDLGAYVFHGTSREPTFIPSKQGTRLLPVYRTITQFGFDLQYTHNSWLWKIESIAREGEGSSFGALVGGFEYTLYQLSGSATDLGLLAEYLYDGRSDSAPFTAFDNDIFVGTRLALNDSQDTALLAGAVIDLEDGTVASRIEGERRLTNHLKVELEGRFFSNVGDRNVLGFFRNDSFVALRVGFFF